MPVKKTRKNATKQASNKVIIDKNSPQAGNGGVIPPSARQFGQPDGNPRHNGAWKKEDTLRFKLQQIAKLEKDELRAGLEPDNPLHWGEYEKSVARILLDIAEPQNDLTTEERWHILNGITNQDSGMPKQQVDQTTYEAPLPLSPRAIITEPQAPKPTVKRKTPKKKKCIKTPPRSKK